MHNWGQLARDFQALAKVTSTNKSSSYMLKVEWNLYGGIYVELGTYDVADWPRITNLGPFDTEEQAYKATKAKIKEAGLAIAKFQEWAAIDEPKPDFEEYKK